jgi:methionine biosynthesis protein MetW
MSEQRAELRFDLRLIANWIDDGTKVLDLGCGTGSLLQHLVREKGVLATGVERSEEKVAAAIGRGLTVIHGDIFEELSDYGRASFDYVILSQTLQQVYDPRALIAEMLRVGHRGVVSFPNFSHYTSRLQHFFLGRAPVTRELPFEWHDTPNIRVIPIRDFRGFCRAEGVHIVREIAISTRDHQMGGHIVKLWPNLRASYGIYMVGRE